MSTTHLTSRIDTRQAVVGVIGLGYVGLPLLRAFWDAGFRVIGFDIDPVKIKQLNAGRNFLKHLGADFVRKMVAPGKRRFEATADFSRLKEADAVMICVPTPLGTHQEPDLSSVQRTADLIAQSLRKGQLVVLESTSYPRTTRDVVLPRLEESGLRLGRDFYLAYSPEREDPGRKGVTTRSIPKLVGGIDKAGGKLASHLYRAAVETVIEVENAEVAEAAKLLENIYRAVNIALVNEMKMVLTAMGIDVWKVIDAAATKPFGFQPFYPGPGLGGHCIPIDPFYLSWKAREVGQPTRFIELAGQVNHAMPDYVVGRTALALNRHGRAVKGAKILVLGLAYKPDIDDLRESPSFELIAKLRKLGAKVDYSDPHVPKAPRVRRHDLKLASVKLTPGSLASYDCVLVATNHKAFDWPLIARHAKLIIDTRNALRQVPGGKSKIINA